MSLSLNREGVNGNFSFHSMFVKKTFQGIFILAVMVSQISGQEKRSVEGAFGAVTIDGKIWNQIALRPVVPIGKFGVALDLVFYIDADGNIHKDEWDFSSAKAIKNTLVDKIYYIRYGYPKDPLFGKVGALDHVKLGYGILTNGYSNTLLYPQQRKVGLEIGVKRSLFSLQGFVNDLKENIGVVGGRIQTSKLLGIPIGGTVVVDWNQFLSLKDRDGDGRPDLVDDFPNDRSFWVDTDGDGLADNNPLEWDVDGDGLTDTLDARIPGWPLDTMIVLDPSIDRKKEPLNVKEKGDRVGAIALDAGMPLFSEENMSISVYVQFAKMFGKTVNPRTGEFLSLGMGIVPFGLSARFGPIRFFLEYRTMPDGRFEFGYWDHSYEIERATFKTEITGEGLVNSRNLSVATKESQLGIYGRQKGYYSRLKIDIGPLFDVGMAYQNLEGKLWDEESGDFQTAPNKSFYASFNLKKAISKIQTAQLYYQQRNVPNPFDFQVNENTIMGYKVGLAVNSGMMIVYTYRKSFRDLDGDGIITPRREEVNITNIETRFMF